MTVELWRRLAAEAIGTALLVIFGAGSFVAALVVGKGQLGYAAIGVIGLSFAFVLAAVVYVFGPVSGAHINPAVTIALAAVRRFPWREVVPYVVAQLGGALGGGLLVNVIFGSAALTANVSGGTVVQPGHTYLQAGVAEALGTALLLFAIMALVVDARAPTGWAGLVIGLVVACEIMVIGPISGGSVNPARTFGPYAATTILGGHTPWQEFWLYWVGPVIGAVAAVTAYVFVAQPRPSTPPPGRTPEVGPSQG
ncbi:MIP/aquaporin family protein [Streptomyces griseoluteus]|uniref:MIP/aquaporin family protein n=1 Tax=Streptomyces griseoluteus TaxID=29306 RepID=UPI003700BC82